MIKCLEKKNMKIYKIVSILAEEKKLIVNNTERGTIPSFGLEERIHAIDGKRYTELCVNCFNVSINRSRFPF